MTAADLPAVAAEECEKVSVCCGAFEHEEWGLHCARCHVGTGFECVIHEVAWDEEGSCPVCDLCWGKGETAHAGGIESPTGRPVRCPKCAGTGMERAGS